MILSINTTSSMIRLLLSVSLANNDVYGVIKILHARCLKGHSSDLHTDVSLPDNCFKMV